MLGRGGRGSFCQNRYARLEIDRRHEVAAARVAVSVQSRRCRADSGHGVPVCEQAVRRETGQDMNAGLLRPLAQPPHDFANRGDMVAMVAHGRRHGDPQRAALAQDVHGLLVHRAAEGKVSIAKVREELPERLRVDHGT